MTQARQKLPQNHNNNSVRTNMPVANNPNNSLIMLPFKPKALTVALCMVSLGISYSSSAQSVLPHQQDEVIAQNTSPLPAVDFTIPAQSADEAIIAFANQANLTVVFPFNKVRHI